MIGIADASKRLTTGVSASSGNRFSRPEMTDSISFCALSRSTS